MKEAGDVVHRPVAGLRGPNRRPIRGLGFVLAVSLVATGVVMVTPARAGCAAAPLVRLDGFPPESVYPQPFYWVEEPESSTNEQFTIMAAGGCGITIGVDYSTGGGTADGSDYQPVTGRSVLPTPPSDDPVFDDIPVNIKADPEEELVAEWFDIVLSNASPPVLDEPTTAPMFIVDRDGPSRAAFGRPAHSQSETWPRAVIPVFRGGADSTAHSVGFEITPGPTNPAMPGEDFTAPASGTLNFAAGDRVETIEVTVINDDQAEEPEDLTITLTGAGLGTQSSTTITILDNEENEPPRSRLHHPRHKWRYAKSDFRIREVHVFTSDTGGSGVVGAQFALRRKRKNGSCQWLMKGGWQRKDCNNRQWLDMKYDEFADLFYVRLKQLKSSVKTKIKNYRAYSRAIDGAGNVERQFNKKRNDNTFQVKRRRKR